MTFPQLRLFKLYQLTLKTLINLNCLFYTTNYIVKAVLLCNNQRDVNDGEQRRRNDKGGKWIKYLEEIN